MRLLTLSSSVLALAIAAGGCGSGSSDEGDADAPPPSTSLTRYLPADAKVLSSVDIAAVREQLGLPDDADALDSEAFISNGPDFKNPEILLFVTATQAIPTLAKSASQFTPNQTLSALDGSKISAVSSTGADPDNNVTAIRTSQPFDRIASALEKLGYERKGDELTKPGAKIEQFARAENDVIVLTSGQASAVDLAASPPGGPKRLVELLADADQPEAFANQAGGGDCLEAYGGWNSADGSEGTAVLKIDGDADQDKVHQEVINANSIEASDPELSGDVVQIPFTSDSADSSNVSPVRTMISSSSLPRAYDCGGNTR